MGTNASTAQRPAQQSEARPADARSRPVEGSVTLGRMPAQPQPRASWAALFPVEKESVGKARRETEFFLGNCQGIPEDIRDTATLLVSELVSNAVTAMQVEPITGIACVEVSLRMFTDRLLIEVVDSSPRIPLPNLASNAEAENGRGLAVVNHFSQEWGYFSRLSRKVVYAELRIVPPEMGIEV